jgi:hypothetical protein
VPTIRGRARPAADGRVDRRAQDDDERPQDEDDLVDDRLPRVGPRQLVRAAASSSLHRARAHEPSWLDAALMTAAQASSAGTGAEVPARATRPSTPTDESSSAQGSTRRCPCRSTSRDSPGPSTATPTAYAAPTTPARAYDARRSSTSRTVPIPSIAMGSRPTRAAVEKARAPGVRSTAP